MLRCEIFWKNTLFAKFSWLIQFLLLGFNTMIYNSFFFLPPTSFRFQNQTTRTWVIGEYSIFPLIGEQNCVVFSFVEKENNNKKYIRMFLVKSLGWFVPYHFYGLHTKHHQDSSDVVPLLTWAFLIKTFDIS